MNLHTNLKQVYILISYQNVLHQFQNENYHPYKSYDGTQPFVLPTIRIEPGPRRRLSSDLTMMSEYDLPLDKHWEFRREQ